MAPERIYLVGFMGAGKSSVGRALSKRLGWMLIDLDSEIERSQKMTVQEIFRQFGEPRFRELERKHLERVSTQRNVVIALGGGAYVDSQNRAIADSTGLTLWLQAAFPRIIQRVKLDGSRPLFEDNDRARRLYDERQPSYAQAQFHVSTDDRTPDAVASEIEVILGQVRQEQS
jgi:shikimate kinase